MKKHPYYDNLSFKLSKDNSETLFRFYVDIWSAHSESAERAASAKTFDKFSMMLLSYILSI